MTTERLTIAFRVSGSAVVGTGHLSRCSALATALESLGGCCRFICTTELTEPQRDSIRSRGWRLDEVPPGLGQAEDARWAARLLSESESVDWLVVDSYELSDEWESAMRGGCISRILAIDDLADRAHQVDVLLDHNMQLSPGRYDRLVPSECIKLLGPRFALLRSEFYRSPRERDGSIRSVLISFGANEQSDTLVQALKALTAMGPRAPRAIALLSRHSAAWAEAERLASGLPDAMLLDHCDDMADLMSSVDVMVGAGGVTSLERAALGLPSITIAIADNQVGPAAALGASGATVYLGFRDDVDDADIGRALERLMKQPRTVRQMSLAARAIGVGNGSQLVARLMRCHAGKGKFELRPMGSEDRDLILAWRNSDRVRGRMFNTETIHDDAHGQWFNRALTDASQRHYVFECGDLPLGTVNFTHLDSQDGTAEWGFYLGETFGPRGIGLEMGALALRTAFEQLGLTAVWARILDSNAASLNYHTKLGFAIAASGLADCEGRPSYTQMRLSAAQWRGQVHGEKG